MVNDYSAPADTACTIGAAIHPAYRTRLSGLDLNLLDLNNIQPTC